MQTNSTVISSKDVNGTKVYNPAGEKLGSIDSADSNPKCNTRGFSE